MVSRRCEDRDKTREERGGQIDRKRWQPEFKSVGRISPHSGLAVKGNSSATGELDYTHGLVVTLLARLWLLDVRRASSSTIADRGEGVGTLVKYNLYRIANFTLRW